MKKVIIFTLSLLVLNLNAQDIFRSRSNETGIRYWVLCPDPNWNGKNVQNPSNLIILPPGKTNSGILFRKASNSQLAAIGCIAGSALALRTAWKDKAASMTDNTIDPGDSYFLSGAFLLAATGFEISYIHNFRSGTRKLAIEQEMAKLEKERMERRIQEIEKRINQ